MENLTLELEYIDYENMLKVLEHNRDLKLKGDNYPYNEVITFTKGFLKTLGKIREELKKEKVANTSCNMCMNCGCVNDVSNN